MSRRDEEQPYRPRFAPGSSGDDFDFIREQAPDPDSCVISVLAYGFEHPRFYAWCRKHGELSAPEVTKQNADLEADRHRTQFYGVA